MEFSVNEEYVAWLVMGYLRERGYHEALSSFMLETGIAEGKMGEEMLYVQRLTLQGRWDGLLQYLQPLRSSLLHNFEEVEFFIRRQQYLEALSYQGGGGHRHALLPWKPCTKSQEDDIDTDAIVNLLKSLEPLCSKKEFNSLCTCLTLERLSDNEDYSSWTVSQGRLECLKLLRSMLYNILPGQNDADVSSTQLRHGRSVDSDRNSGLLLMLAMGLAYQKTAGGDSNARENTESMKQSKSEWNALSKILYPEDSKPLPLRMFPKVCLTHQLSSRTDISDDELIKTKKEVKIVDRGQSVEHTSDRPRSSSGPSSRNVELHIAVNNEKYSSEEKIPFAVVNNVDNLKALLNGDEKAQHDIKDPRHTDRESKTEDDTGIDGSKRGKHRAPMSWVVDVVDNNNPEGSNKGNIIVPPVLTSQRRNSKHATPPSNNATSQNNPPSSSVGMGGNGGNKNDKSKFKQIAKVMTNPWESNRDNRLREAAHCIVYTAPCPLRCVNIIMATTHSPSERSGNNNNNNNNNDDRQTEEMLTLAVGSNNKSIHILSAMTSSPSTERSAMRGGENDSTTRFESQVTVDREFVDIHRGSVYALDWTSFNGQKIVVSGSNDKYLRISNVDTGISSGSLKGHNGTIRCVKFRKSHSCANYYSTNDQLQERDDDDQSTTCIFASAGAGDCRARLWDVTTASCICTYEAHPDAIHGISWCDNNVFLSGCDKGRVIAHDIRSSSTIWRKDMLSSLSGGGGGICTLTSIGNTSIAGCTDGFVNIFESFSGNILCVERLHTHDVRAVSVVPFQSSDASVSGSSPLLLLTSSFDSTAAIWKLTPRNRSGVSNDNISAESDCKLERLSTLQGVHTDKILSADIVPKSFTVVTSGADGKTVVWKPT